MRALAKQSRAAARRLVLVMAIAVSGALAAGAASAGADPIVMAAGDVACASAGTTTPGACSQRYTAGLLLNQQGSPEGLAAVLAMGDLQYENGGESDFNNYFGTSWGVPALRGVLHPALGNHEYQTSGAAGYFNYFASIGVNVGARGQGWYSFDVGSWHLIALNSSNACSPVSCAAGSPQETWLRNDLAATSQPCVMAYWHHPLASLGAKGRAIWQDLYDAGADAVLVGHVHGLKAPVALDANGASDPAGPRQFQVGTGGKSGSAFGVMKFALGNGGYSWQFVGSGGNVSGSAACHGSPPPPPPAPTAGFTTSGSGLTASFTDASTGAPTSWSWSFGDGATSAARNPTHTYARAGSYTVSLTAANAGGSTTATSTVTVAPASTPVATVPVVTSPAAPGAAIAATVAAGGPAASLGLSLPRPTGSLPVGVRTTFVSDPARTDATTHRARAIPVRVWYPASRRGGTAAPYLSGAVRAAVEQRLSLSSGTLGLATPAVAGAPARAAIRGVVLLSPAAGAVAAMQSALAIDLASRGYVVVAIDHPHDGLAVATRDGSVILRDAGLRSAAALRGRARDVSAVLARLSRLVPQRRRSTPVAIIGTGLGAATAARALAAHPSLLAGVGIDAAAGRSRVRVSKAFGLVLRSGARARRAAAALAVLRGPRPAISIDVERYGFTDFALFNAEARAADAALGTGLERLLPTGPVASVAAARAAIARERGFVAAFLRRYAQRER